jgi:hypothetical protein
MLKTRSDFSPIQSDVNSVSRKIRLISLIPLQIESLETLQIDLANSLHLSQKQGT